MVVIRIVLWILFALFLLIGLVLSLKITVRLKYEEEKSVILGIGLLRINLTKLRKKRENKRKKKPKIQHLSESLPDYTDKNSKTQKNNNAVCCNETGNRNSQNEENPVKEDIQQDAEKQINSSNDDSETIKEKKNTHKKSIPKMLKELMNGKNLTESLGLVRDIVFETARSFSKYALIKVAQLSVVVSCEMAADTAIMFGIANGLVSSVIAICESFRMFTIKDGAICVYQDYISGKSKLSLDISLSIRVYHILLCLLPTLKAFTNKNNIKSSQKEKKS